MPTSFAAVLSFLLLVATSWWIGTFTVRLLPAELRAPRTFLALPLGLITFLTLFSIFAHYIPSYWVTIPLAALAPVGILSRIFPDAKDAQNGNNLPCFTLFFLVAAATLWMHSQWPSLHWDNSGAKAGVEKMFNLSIQQSFLHGSTYPPEWIWLSGEVSRYYLLPKAFPGLASWIARTLFLDPQAGGYHFLFSEALYVALAASSFAAWIIVLMGLCAPRASLSTLGVVGVTTGALSFLCTHYFGFMHGLTRFFSGTSLSWWELQEQVVHYTQNQYPVWLVILGDNHAYSQITMFQISCWACCILACIWGSFSPCLVVLGALSAASVYLSHIPSVLLNLVTLLPGILTFLLIEGVRRNVGWVGASISNLLMIGLGTALLIFPNSTITGDTKWVIPSANIASPLFSFLSVQFWPLLWLTFVVVLCGMAHTISTQGLRAVWQLHPHYPTKYQLEKLILPILGGLVVGVLSGRPALFVVGVCSGVVLLFGSSTDRVAEPSRQRILAVLAAWTFGLWILPELLAIDNRADNRTLWIRFNIVLRFWPEGYTLLPFVITAAFASPLADALTSCWWRSRFGIAYVGASAILIALFSVSHIPGIKDRAAHIGVPPSLNGYSFLEREAPYDYQVIQYLAQLPSSQKVVIGEACGTWRYDKVPVNYAWPGRISAFSGRTAVCGWSRHAELHQPRLDHAWRGSHSTRDRFLAYEDALLTVYRAAGAALPSWSESQKEEWLGPITNVTRSRGILAELGVTHIVYGEREAAAYGALPLANLARSTNGAVVFQVPGTEYGVVTLNR
jgi:uncharacterized membrane protein